jgi:hypothetical protein
MFLKTGTVAAVKPQIALLIAASNFKSIRSSARVFSIELREKLADIHQPIFRLHFSRSKFSCCVSGHTAERGPGDGIGSRGV